MKTVTVDTTDLQVHIEINVRPSPERLRELLETQAEALKREAETLERDTWLAVLQAMPSKERGT